MGPGAVEVALPVTDAELLVEGSFVSAHVWDTTTILITHVEELAVELLVGIEAYRPVRAVEGKGHIRKLLPSFRLVVGENV